jgi:hypothetical protein
MQGSYCEPLKPCPEKRKGRNGDIIEQSRVLSKVAFGGMGPGRNELRP